MSARQIPQNSRESSETKTLVDILFGEGALDVQQVNQIKLTEIQTGAPQEEIIRSQKLVSEKNLVKAKAKLVNVAYVDLTNAPTSPEALALVSQDVAAKLKVIPLHIDPLKRQLDLAMADPLDLSAIEFIEQKSGMTVIPKAAEPSLIEEYVASAYTTSLAREVTAALREVTPEADRLRALEATGSVFGMPAQAQKTVIREEKVAEIVSHILEFAVKGRASDVHIEPQERSTRVRYRIDGILQEKLNIPRELHDALISRIKILSGMKIDEKRIPQDGRFSIHAEDEEVDLRVSTLPTVHGEKVVMRLLKKEGGIPTLTELGLRGTAMKVLNEAILRPHGIIIMCGPTGSGKTTTLYSIIQTISTPQVNIVTLEDPIEYKVSGVNQVQINPAAGLTFASGLRAFLRQDPNIILVGEIRDQETADLAIQASLTGHLVFSTLHTNDASDALPRLLDMGAEPYLLGSSITAIVGQRVVRKVHEDCKVSYSSDEAVTNELKSVLGRLWPGKDGEPILLYKGEGDKECGDTGYFGRIGIFEVLPVTPKISRLILERASPAEIEDKAREEGMVTMKQDGFLKALSGITSIEEVLRVGEE